VALPPSIRIWVSFCPKPWVPLVGPHVHGPLDHLPSSVALVKSLLFLTAWSDGSIWYSVFMSSICLNLPQQRGYKWISNKNGGQVAAFMEAKAENLHWLQDHVFYLKGFFTISSQYFHRNGTIYACMWLIVDQICIDNGKIKGKKL